MTIFLKFCICILKTEAVLENRDAFIGPCGAAGKTMTVNTYENMMSPVGLNIISGKQQQLVRKAILRVK